MASTISAGTTSGTAIAIAGDTSGALSLQTNNGTTAVTIDTSANLQFNSGYGSVATAYGCRAWVNFNGTGTVAIRASGNVSSITDDGVGLYRINMTNAMPDTNFCLQGTGGGTTGGFLLRDNSDGLARTTSMVRINTASSGPADQDQAFINIAIFR